MAELEYGEAGKTPLGGWLLVLQVLFTYPQIIMIYASLTADKQAVLSSYKVYQITYNTHTYTRKISNMLL